MGIGAHFSHRNVKNFHRTVIFTVRELAYTKLFIFFCRIYRKVRDFNFTVPVPVPINDRCREIHETANPILFKF
jgi:N-glycosylase/DNA lyase